MSLLNNYDIIISSFCMTIFVSSIVLRHPVYSRKERGKTSELLMFQYIFMDFYFLQ